VVVILLVVAEELPDLLEQLELAVLVVVVLEILAEVLEHYPLVEVEDLEEMRVVLASL
jgi:hypothetical protein|tara:strand:+ start:368 stop:541 length:174 start_codon:yes stop_codon:yes gene_type:complete